MSDKHRAQQVEPGTVFPTGWMFTNATHYVGCLHCDAPAGFYCVQPNGRDAPVPHMVRLRALRQQRPDIVALSVRPTV